MFSVQTLKCGGVQIEQHAERGQITGAKQAAPEQRMPGAQKRTASQNSSSRDKPMTARQVPRAQSLLASTLLTQMPWYQSVAPALCALSSMGGVPVTKTSNIRLVREGASRETRQYYFQQGSSLGISIARHLPCGLASLAVMGRL